MKKISLLLILLLTSCSGLDGKWEYIPNLTAPVVVIDVYKPDDNLNGYIVLRDANGKVWQGHFMSSGVAKVVSEKYQKGDTLFVSK